MEYITTKEASAKWGISPTRITILANEGRIPGAQRLGKSWLIPASATKPPARSTNSNAVRKETVNFSFPMYHFRPDWSYIKESHLSEQQQCLLSAETAVLECRFEDAYPLLESILDAPDDIVTEIGCLWYTGICCIGLNKPADFSKIYLRLQMLLAEDFPHRDDLTIILDALNTYVETMGSIARNFSYNTEINEQCFPLVNLLNGYAILTKEAIKPGTADTNIMEINLHFLQNTSAVIVVEMMHCYLLGIYFLRQDTLSAERHAKCLVQIAFENKFYFPLVTYYRYFASVLSPVINQYPKEFQDHCHRLISQYEKSFTTFLSSLNQYVTFSKLTNADYPFIYAILTDLPNSLIASKFEISPNSVKYRLKLIYEKLDVHSKKELKDYLHNCM